ncbi:alpha-D-ribose 1-methylphosphonate 5-triphosphate synthase subunit PhnG [Planomicrobium stackebrandtii]|uniref:Alpha-D-ribose 1-methylphosphonate 5-triphosphate synthase subunit PhnG n=1 Tax=Planomicrobium stackebrandtii TaxID=253160 RepID=A0ABU0GVF8_9BACL|nr:phosphonate C-P lyase system protein PhnG [Planomicrobium stackebrandtii]MDQ0429348.1 alpha-D-ribose 1-methylphosphonate 5-triphosphate synthase subunit PhnG [Planomicrobium stackebrandtii]
MKRRKRTEILIQGDGSLAKALAVSITQKYECREVSVPEQGMIMVKMRESAKNSLFYMGEVLITEAKVEISGKIGTGLLVGMDEQRATHLAIIDAAYKAQLPEAADWEHQLLEEEKKIRMAKAQQQAELFETKVSFETMEV